MTFLEVLFYALIEGLTEFLPVSSTGHLIVFSYFLGKQEDAFIKSFEVIIQFGAIFSVLVVYWRNFFSSFEFYKKLFVSFLPAGVIGFLLKDIVNQWLGNLSIVAWALIIGGFILIACDFIFKKSIDEGKGLEQLSYTDAFWLGCFQCLALIPGVSRSGATIVGGLALHFHKKAAAEFSFFLAVPTIAAASAYKLVKIAPQLDASYTSHLLLGTVLSFVFAIIAIKFFIHLVSRFGFKHFGYYRIILGSILLFLIYRG